MRKVGFTFIELMLVTAIIGILAGLSIPLFRRTFSDIQLTTSSQGIVSLARYARQRAIIERSPYRLNLDVDKNRYWLNRLKLSSKEDREFEDVEGKFGKVYFLPREITIFSKSPHISFYPDGSSDKVNISLTNVNGKTNKLTTKGPRGSVKIITE